MSARAVARRVLRRIESEGGYASAALDAELAAHRLDDRDRRLATELVYGVLRHRSRLDRALVAMTERGLGKTKPAVRTILRVAAYQLLFLDRVPAHAAVDDAVRATRRIGGARLGGFANGVLRRLARDGEPALPGVEDLLHHVEATYSLSPWLVDRLLAAVGPDELVAAAAGLTAPAPLAIRVNTLRIEPDALAELLRGEGAEVRAVPDCPEALLVDRLGAPEQSRSFVDGLWTVQDVAAQMVSRLLLAPPAPPGPRLLDGCSGVGGKATHLAQLTGDRQPIDAVDLSAAKLARAEETAARLGVRSLRPRVADLLIEGPGEPYHGVLLDAPCSGLGVLRRHPEAKWRIGEADVAALVELQRRLLDAAADWVAPSGVLVYSVCTFTPEEGRDQVSALLARRPDLSLVEELVTWPHRQSADGFFAAKLVRGS